MNSLLHSESDGRRRVAPSIRPSWLVVLGLSLSACGGPCDSLAAKMCELSGADSVGCAGARAKADGASAQTVHACELGLAFAHELGRGR